MHKTAHTRETPFLSWIHRCSRCNEFPRLLWWQKTINAFAALHFFYILSHLIIEANARSLFSSSFMNVIDLKLSFSFWYVDIYSWLTFSAWFLLQKMAASVDKRCNIGQCMFLRHSCRQCSILTFCAKQSQVQKGYLNNRCQRQRGKGEQTVPPAASWSMCCCCCLTWK